jgi:hypothetical protein
VSAIDVLMKHGADVRAREEKYHGTPPDGPTTPVTKKPAT